MQTRAGVTCPLCKKPKSTQYVALEAQPVRRNGNVVLIQPHEYAVCAACYAKQFKNVYGMTPNEAAKAKTQRNKDGEDPLFAGTELLDVKG